MTKLFASDFDGTLYLHDDGPLIRPHVLDAIAQFREAGGLFGVCTGRPLLALTDQVGDAIPFDFYIAATGSAVYDRDRQPIVEHFMDRDLVREMCERYTRELGENCVFVVSGGRYWSLSPESSPTIPFVPTAPFEELEGPFTGFSLLLPWEGGYEQATEVNADIAARYGEFAIGHQNLDSIDVVPVGCSKGSGLALAADHFGATFTAGMGDSLNDLPLLQAADVSYTFHRCAREVRDAAALVVEDAAAAILDFMAR